MTQHLTHFTILLSNTNGLTLTRRHLLKPIINSINPDIICLNETKFVQNKEPKTLFTNYTSTYNSLKFGIKSSHFSKWGTAILAKSHLHISSSSTPISPTLSGRLTSISLLLPSNPPITLEIFCAYAPGSSQHKSSFFNTLRKKLAKSHRQGHLFILAGDLNSHLSTSDYVGPNPKPCLALQNFAALCPFPLYDTHKILHPNYNVALNPTHSQLNTKSRIDYILSNFNKGLLSSWISNSHGTGTDHATITLKLDLNAWNTYHLSYTLSPRPPLPIFPSTPDHRLPLFHETCNNLLAKAPPSISSFLSPPSPLQPIPTSSSNIEQCLDFIANLCTDVATSFFPPKKPRQHHLSFPKHSSCGTLLKELRWLNKAITAFTTLSNPLCNDPRLIKSKLLLLNNPPFDLTPPPLLFDTLDPWFLNLKNIRTHTKNNLRREMTTFHRERKQEYINAITSNSKKNNKTLRHLILPSKPQLPGISAIWDKNNNLLFIPDEVADFIASHFEDLGRPPPISANKHSPWRHPSLSANIRSNMSNWIQTHGSLANPLSLSDLQHSITHRNTAPGRDHTQFAAIRALPPSILNLLLNTLNHIIIHLQVPHSLKLGEVVLLFKGEPLSPLDINSYRDITLLKSFYKIITHTLAHRFQQATEHTVALQEATGGYRPGRTCGHKVQILINSLSHAARANIPIFFACIDISKAFPSTPHRAFIHALKDIGVDSHCINLHKALQSDFSCRFRLRHGTSRDVSINNGCKQGCGASPSKFINVLDMFVRWLASFRLGYSFFCTHKSHSHIQQQILHIDCIFIVDDDTFISRSQTTLQDIVNKYTTFLNNYGLKISTNPKKSFSSYRLPLSAPLLPPPPIIVHQDNLHIALPLLPPNQPFRLLGYHFSADLSSNLQQDSALLNSLNTLKHLSGQHIPFLAKARIINAEILGSINYASDVLPYPDKWLLHSQVILTRALCWPSASAHLNSLLPCLPIFPFHITNLKAACLARCLSALINFVNGPDSTCSSSTLMTLLDYQAQCISHKPLFTSLPKPSIKLYPPNIQKLAKALPSSLIKLIDNASKPHFPSLPPDFLFAYLPSSTTPPPLLLKTLRTNKVTLGDISPWFRTDSSGLCPIENHIINQTPVSDLDLHFLPPATPPNRPLVTFKVVNALRPLLRSAIPAFIASPSSITLIAQSHLNTQYLLPSPLPLSANPSDIGCDGSFSATSNRASFACVSSSGYLLRSSIPGKQSIHRAEGFAILSSCILHDDKNTLHIWSDSKSWIDLLHSYLLSPPLPSKLRHIKNRDILLAIISATKKRTHRTLFHFVKAHTDTIDLPHDLNRSADWHAKIANNVPSAPVILDTWPFRDKLFLTINNLPQDTNIYSALYKHLLYLFIASAPPSTALLRSSLDSIWVEASIHSLSSKLHHFSWKIFSHTLPTLHRQHNLLPHLYLTNQCLFCNEPETDTHLFLYCRKFNPQRRAALFNIKKLTSPSQLNHSVNFWFPLCPPYSSFPTDDAVCAKLPSSLRLSLLSRQPNKILLNQTGRRINRILIATFHLIWSIRCKKLINRGYSYEALILSDAAKHDYSFPE